MLEIRTSNINFNALLLLSGVFVVNACGQCRPESERKIVPWDVPHVSLADMFPPDGDPVLGRALSTDEVPIQTVEQCRQFYADTHHATLWDYSVTDRSDSENYLLTFDSHPRTHLHVYFEYNPRNHLVTRWCDNSPK